jgi:hypothetical protein
MSSKETNLRLEISNGKIPSSKTKKIKKGKQGRKKSTISNFLITTFEMIDVRLIRIPKAKIQSFGTRMALRSSSRTLRTSLKSSLHFSKREITLLS